MSEEKEYICPICGEVLEKTFRDDGDRGYLAGLSCKCGYAEGDP